MPPVWKISMRKILVIKKNLKCIIFQAQKSSIQAQQLRETLQVYLIRTRVEEAMMDDKRTSLMQHLNLVSNAFEALTQHIQSLEVSYLAAERVFNVSRALLAYREPSSADDSINEDFVLYHRQVILNILGIFFNTLSDKKIMKL